MVYLQCLLKLLDLVRNTLAVSSNPRLHDATCPICDYHTDVRKPLMLLFSATIFVDQLLAKFLTCLHSHLLCEVYKNIRIKKYIYRCLYSNLSSIFISIWCSQMCFVMLGPQVFKSTEKIK